LATGPPGALWNLLHESAMASKDYKFVPGEVQPRDVWSNPRCPECKTGPMFHPAHLYGACRVMTEEGGACGCTHGAETATVQRSD
jgi:hypothetical protein